MSKIFRRSRCQKASDGTDGAHRAPLQNAFRQRAGLSTFGRPHKAARAEFVLPQIVPDILHRVQLG